MFTGIHTLINNFYIMQHLLPVFLIENLELNDKMAEKEDVLRAMQNCFLSIGKSENENRKIDPQTNRILIFQKRWVTLDSLYMRYFQKEKDIYSKRILAVSSVNDVLRVGELKFEVLTQNRNFLFRTKSHSLREEWVAVLQETVQQRRSSMELAVNLSEVTKNCHGSVSLFDKQGYLEMTGLRSKLYVVIFTKKVILYRNAEEHSQGLGITFISMNNATVKRTEKHSFSLITPHKTFSFLAESDQQREEWVEAMTSCVDPFGSGKCVRERIWSKETNWCCADCGAPRPDWASLNLCVVLCECCAGVHRSLGQAVSKVRKLKRDDKEWTDPLIQLFLVLGNGRANLFWAGNTPPSELLCPTSGSEERERFITAKYCHGKYRVYHPLFGHQEELNKALCSSVQQDDILETLSLVFCGANVNCCTGDSKFPSPLSLAQHKGQTIQVEFLKHNLNTGMPGYFPEECTVPQFVISQTGYLFKTASSTRAFTSCKSKGDFSQRWCHLDQGTFSYYESEKSVTKSGGMKMSDIECLVVNPTGKHGYRYTFEMYHSSGRVYLFGADTLQTVQEWITIISKAIVPRGSEDLVCWSFERVGRLCYTEGPNPHCPHQGWLALAGHRLLLFLHGAHRVEELDLRKLHKFCVQQETIVLVEKGWTVCVKGDRRPDFQGWVISLQEGSGRGDGPLDQQQLTNVEIPVIVDCCLRYITQHGLKSVGIYRKAGVQSKISSLLDAFLYDAREVQLSHGGRLVDDVANTLKRFLREVQNGVFNGEQAALQWLNNTVSSEVSERVSMYQSLLSGLLPVHKATLEAIINHLYCVQCFVEDNRMNPRNLSVVFGPTLFQMDGADKRAVLVVEDLIVQYRVIFNVDEEKLQKQLDMISHIIDVQEKCPDELTASTPTIFGIYFEKKEEDAELLVQISQTVSAAELVDDVLKRSDVSMQHGQYWACFLVHEREEMERPLHHKERVMPIYASLDKDCYLVVKKNHYMKEIKKLNAGRAEVSRNGIVKFCEEKGQRGKGNFCKHLCILSGSSLKILKEVKSSQPEKECQVQRLKVFHGIRNNLQPPSNWGMTVVCEQNIGSQHQWYLCCESENEMLEWLATFMSLQHGGDFWPVVTR